MSNDEDWPNSPCLYGSNVLSGVAVVMHADCEHILRSVPVTTLMSESPGRIDATC